MIIKTEKDVISIKGVLNRNLWPSMQAAVSMMTLDGCKNIIVDCSEITDITSEGLETFAQAFKYNSSKNINIIFTNVHEKIEKLAKQTPGVRSAMPIVRNIEEARASVRINESIGRKYTERDFIFPVLGNLSHAVMFADRLVRKDREFSFVYPMLVPRAYNLNQPVKALENKAKDTFMRIKGFCVFLGRTAKSNIVRSRDYEGFFRRLTDKFINSHIIVSFAGADMENRDNISKFAELSRNRDLCSIAVTEPFDKTKPYDLRTDIKKILVYVTDDEEYNRQTMSLLKDFYRKDTKTDFLKVRKIKWGETPKDTTDTIENFSVRDFKRSSCKTITTRIRSVSLKKYIKENSIDLAIIPLLENDENFLLNMCREPICIVCFISKNFYRKN